MKTWVGYVVILILSAACLLTLCLTASLGSATSTTIYATDNRDGYLERADEAYVCDNFSDWVATYNTAAAYAGYRSFVSAVYLFDRAFFSFVLDTITEPVDSARVFIYVPSLVSTCTGDANIGVYVGDCCILGGIPSCSGILAGTDSARCTILKRQWPVSQFTAASWVSFKVTSDSITAGSGHTYDIRIATTSNEIPAVCGCTVSLQDRITFTTVNNATNKPYIVVYTTTAGERKRTWGQIKADSPDVWPLRKQLIYGDVE